MPRTFSVWSLIGVFVGATMAEAQSKPNKPAFSQKASPAAKIDLSKESGPISPYLYGQFIEHLGRCIYGGIWAELLEDRKFFASVGGSGSPWKKAGGEVGWSLTMDVERPHVGAWSVKVAVSERAADELHGIAQNDLGIVAGKEYVGRVIVAGEGTVEAILAWGEKPEQSQAVTITNVGSDFKAHDFRFKAGGTTDNASLTIG